ncbi:hypothetical protein RZS28_16855 [Methylocapsa polymorpha]|uniref:Uncharacterized protein n=1 Tax=Methylocapsa polymorpha TaxID=3080828 RepID=A0ABZ0HQ73_9HYPH|nr:hypothetical protein RZS28_16855 [Methylocapsa sp. RX1]
MAIEIDGLTVLRAIVATPLIFPDAAAEINSLARKLVAGQLKPTTTNLERLRDIYRVIGGEVFAHVLEGQADSTSAALVKKLDKDNPDLKTAPAVRLRQLLVELASGAAEPVGKPVKPAPSKPKTSGKAKAAALTVEQKAIGATLKDKGISLEKARAIWRNAGEENFKLVLGGLTEKQTADLAKRLDKDNSELKGATSDWCRQRIADLARAAAEPVFKNIMESKAMAAKRTTTPEAN